MSQFGTGSPTDMSLLWDWKFNQHIYTNGPQYAYMLVTYSANRFIKQLSYIKSFIITATATAVVLYTFRNRS